MPRNLRSEYDNYHSSEEQKRKRASRNAARREMERKGRVSKGDGKDVDHSNGNPRTTAPLICVLKLKVATDRSPVMLKQVRNS